MVFCASGLISSFLILAGGVGHACFRGGGGGRRWQGKSCEEIARGKRGQQTSSVLSTNLECAVFGRLRPALQSSAARNAGRTPRDCPRGVLGGGRRDGWHRRTKAAVAGAAPGSLVRAPASWRAILRPMRLARRDDGAGTRQPCFVGGFEGRGGPAGSNRRTKTPREEEVGMEGRSLPAWGWSRSWLARWGTQQSKIGFVQT